MITFLPYPNFKQTAKCLDYKRLGKQRVEAYQLLRGLLGMTKGWNNHPASRMWRGYELALWQYTREIIKEWILLGYKDTMLEKLYQLDHKEGIVPMPSWLGNIDVHHSHQANLVRKLPEHYIPYFGNLPSEPYYWPV